MKSLLLDEQPLLIMPKLATKIGLNESIALQQIHYWLEINKKANKNFRDGRFWTFNSYAEWEKQFPFWSSRTIQRSITNLEKMKLVITGNYNKLKIDRTKWYSIDYKVVEILEKSPFGQIGTINMTEWHNHIDKLAPPLPEINTEINNQRLELKDSKGTSTKVSFDVFLKNISEDYLLESKIHLEVIKYYCDGYEFNFQQTLKYTFNEWTKYTDGIFECSDYIGQPAIETIKAAIDLHFDYSYNFEKMYLLHNFKDEVKDNRIFETGMK